MRIQIMDNWEERREHPRFSVKGSFTHLKEDSFEVESATAQIKSKGLRGMLFGYSKTRYRILNVSKGGLAFESETAFSPGQRLTMLIHLPQRPEPFEVIGEVRWQKDVFSKYVLVTVGVQFAPFGDESGMNAPEVLQILQELESTYLSGRPKRQE